jgi:AcrR family transcriptional regulator
MKSSLRKSPSDYRHGDLRNALVAAAREELAAGKYETLSVRELARRAGVAPNAFYRHFESKEAILAALATEGFEELTARFDALPALPALTPGQRLCLMSDTYTGFAEEHPAQYRLMFGCAKASLMASSALHDAATGCFGRLVAATIAVSGSGGPEDPQILQRALDIWSLVHGWSMLQVDGIPSFLPPTSMRPASVATEAIIESWG